LLKKEQLKLKKERESQKRALAAERELRAEKRNRHLSSVLSDYGDSNEEEETR
jgi:hypothetical protein